MVSAIESVNHSRYRAIMNIITEEWRPVAGAEGRYEVSNLGRVRSLPRTVCCNRKKGTPKHRSVAGKILAPGSDTDGYAMAAFALTEGGKVKSYKIHQLVAHTFLGKQPEGTWVLHGPNGKTDNSCDNLYYGTPRQNIADKWRDGTVIVGEAHHKAKLKEADVINIRQLRANGALIRVIADQYCVGASAINKIVTGQNWKWLTS
jgi:hypothetical protein